MVYAPLLSNMSTTIDPFGRKPRSAIAGSPGQAHCFAIRRRPASPRAVAVRDGYPRYRDRCRQVFRISAASPSQHVVRLYLFVSQCELALAAVSRLLGATAVPSLAPCPAYHNNSSLEPRSAADWPLSHWKPDHERRIGLVASPFEMSGRPFRWNGPKIAVHGFMRFLHFLLIRSTRGALDATYSSD